MDNIESEVGTILLAIDFLLLTLRTIVELTLIFYLSNQFMPITSRILDYGSKLTGNSRYDFFTYLVTWLFIAPIISGLFENLMLFAAYRKNFGSFGYLNFYMLGLTTWSFDNNFEKFKLRPIGTIILRGVAFLVLIYIINIISDTIDIYGSSILKYLVTYVLRPTVSWILIIYYIGKNRIFS